MDNMTSVRRRLMMVGLGLAGIAAAFAVATASTPDAGPPGKAEAGSKVSRTWSAGKIRPAAKSCYGC